MNLPNDLIKQFAKITNDDSTETTTSKSVYGTVVTDGENMYVRLDGTDILTPVIKVMDAVDGDRVTVSIENHTATITGNISSPASARTADSYMKLTEEGLAIGELNNDGDVTGMSSLIGPGSYYILDEDGNKIASFSGTQIILGNGDALFSPTLVKIGKNGNSEISFCDEFGSIKVEDNVMRLKSQQPLGIRNEVNSSNNRRRAEVVCTNDNGIPKAIIQAYTQDQYSESSVVVSSGAVNINTQNEIDEEGPDLFFYQAYVNGDPIITANRLFITGRIKATGVAPANDAVKIRVEQGIPYGYTLCGIRQITTNHDHVCHITEFVTNVSEVGVTLYNASSTDQNMEVTIEWFALRTGDVIDQGETIYKW